MIISRCKNLEQNILVRVQSIHAVFPDFYNNRSVTRVSGSVVIEIDGKIYTVDLENIIFEEGKAYLPRAVYSHIIEKGII